MSDEPITLAQQHVVETFRRGHDGCNGGVIWLRARHGAHEFEVRVMRGEVTVWAIIEGAHYTRRDTVWHVTLHRDLLLQMRGLLTD